jgi:hypothetical protein
MVEGVKEMKLTVSVTGKRNRKDDKVSSLMENRLKVAAIEPGEKEKRRIWETSRRMRHFRSN